VPNFLDYVYLDGLKAVSPASDHHLLGSSVKIATRLKLAQLICIVLLAVMAAIFARTTLQMRRSRQGRVTSEVLRGAAGLRYLSLEYELHHGERSRLQWLHAARLAAKADRRRWQLRCGTRVELLGDCASAYNQSPPCLTSCRAAGRTRAQPGGPSCRNWKPA
jgi:hypothetical protein